MSHSAYQKVLIFHEKAKFLSKNMYKEAADVLLMAEDRPCTAIHMDVRTTKLKSRRLALRPALGNIEIN